MDVCEKLETCPFYQNKLVIENNLGNVLKKKYCEGNKLECARYKVLTSAGPDYVDNLLFPHMMDRALMIIAEVKKQK